jgi:hypothetical protein
MHLRYCYYRQAVPFGGDSLLVTALLLLVVPTSTQSARRGLLAALGWRLPWWLLI